MVFESEFSIYQKVTIAGDIQAIVTSIQFLAKNYTLIKCEWISAGNVNFAWFDEEQLKEYEMMNSASFDSFLYFIPERIFLLN